MAFTRTSSHFFRQHSSCFDPLVAGLRECQVGAFCAVRAHFSLSNEPCIVSLPTGSGKTALMMAISFGLQARRVLIINPAEVLRTQTAEKFGSLTDLRSAGALKALSLTKKPKVLSVSNELRYRKQWEALSKFDVITATTRTTSPLINQIVSPPNDLFDLVFVDEGHHAAAATWKALVSQFDVGKTRIVLLTGTPYRRDNKQLGAKPIYIYPISRAISDQVYAPVSLVTAGSPGADQRDEVLADSGIRELRRLSKLTTIKPLLFVKTDRKVHADSLGKLYLEKGITLGVVHSDQGDKANRAAIVSASRGKSDGLVVVGMLGEGLDIPALKVSVFHRNPQSLPYTLQVVGRLARSGDKLPNGVVVACSDDFSRDTFRLFDGSEDWLKLIPQLEAVLIDQIAPRYSEQVAATGAHLDIGDIRPHFSAAAVYLDTPVRACALKNRIFQTIRGVSTVVLDHQVDPGLRVVVTRTVERPIWLRLHGMSEISNERFDVHTYYYGTLGVLVRQSTDDSIGQMLQCAFAADGSEVPASKLNHVMSSLGGEYLVLGLKNGSAISHTQPSYKMLLGHRVDASVSNTDRMSSHAGHCFSRKVAANGDKPEYRGVAYRRGRVWSLDRKNLRQLGAWMKVIAESITLPGDAALPDLNALRQPQALVEFPAAPIAILPSAALLTRDVKFVRDQETFLQSPCWAIGATSKHRIAASMPDLGAEYSISLTKGKVCSAENGSSGWTVEVFPVDGQSRDFSLTEFVTEFPPVLVFSDGSSWNEGIYTRPSYSPVFSAEELFPQNWRGCDTGKEVPDAAPSGNSVHEFIERNYITASGDAIGICDHGKGEIADFVIFNPSTRLVSLHHCKAARKNRAGAVSPPGVDQKCLEELVVQGMASCRWIRNPDLSTQLKKRLDAGIARFVSGDRVQLNTIADTACGPGWRFEIVLVQPGLSGSKARSQAAGRRVRSIVGCAQDYVQGCGGKLKILCS